MPDLTITLPYVDSRRQQHMYHGLGQPYARVDLNPMPESTTLSTNKELWIWTLIRNARANIVILCQADVQWVVRNVPLQSIPPDHLVQSVPGYLVQNYPAHLVPGFPALLV
jgi:hypothetical protein